MLELMKQKSFPADFPPKELNHTRTVGQEEEEAEATIPHPSQQETSSPPGQSHVGTGQPHVASGQPPVASGQQESVAAAGQPSPETRQQPSPLDCKLR